MSFIASRTGLLVAAAILAAVSLVVFRVLEPESRAMATLGALATFAIGLLGVQFIRVSAALRHLHGQTARLAELPEVRAELNATRARLALAERRLSALAIKLEATDELDEPRA